MGEKNHNLSGPTVDIDSPASIAWKCMQAGRLAGQSHHHFLDPQEFKVMIGLASESTCMAGYYYLFLQPYIGYIKEYL